VPPPSNEPTGKGRNEDRRRLKDMNKPITIIDAIRHKQLFGSLPALQSLSTWASWIVWLKAIFALDMTPDELAVYQQCTGRQTPPTKQPSEVFTIVGRRGGKSFISAIVACYLACFESYTKYLNAGERGVILVLAVDKEQARIIFLYITGIIRAIPALSQMIVTERVNDIELSTGVIIMVSKRFQERSRAFCCCGYLRRSSVLEYRGSESR
jgi:hypothetical protein